MESSKYGEYIDAGYKVDSSKSFGINEIDGKELWLIKIPKDLPFESLPNKLQVSDINKVSVKSIDINKKKYTIHQDDTQEITSLFNVWSKNDHGKMGLGKPFNKFIQIDETVELPKEKITPTPIPKPTQQHNLLKGVYDPPGSTGFLKKVKEEKLNKSNSTTVTTSKISTKKESEVKKEKEKEKEKEKKKKKQESSSEEEEESSEEDKKKKKSSKKPKKSSKKQESSEESSSEEEKKSSKKSKSKKSSKKQESSDEEDKSDKKKKDSKRKKDDTETEQIKKKHKK